jgi:signal transduction histidine kinase
MAEPNEVDRLPDQIVKGKKPDELLGRDGVLKELTKRLVERALEGELTIHGDASQLEAAVRNLLDHALKFTRAGDRIACEVAESGTVALLVADDAGRGIPEDEREQIFNPI